MRSRILTIWLAVVVMVYILAVTNIASAEIIRGIDIDFVTIGNPGNPGDTRVEANPIGCGAVDYVYRIGKYEITAVQWQTINTVAGIGNSGYFSGNQPVGDVTWIEAARFCNYLTTGDTEDGVYKLSEDSLIDIMNHTLAGSTYGVAYFLPTEDEWYKAAYYTGSGYSTYANGTDIAPIAGVDSNWDMVMNEPWDVGSGTEEQNGTFDMMGNLWEWNETIDYDLHAPLPSYGHRGGALASGAGGLDLSSNIRAFVPLPFVGEASGFRIASIPEPATLLLLGLGAVMMRRGKK